jgi:acyl carrier protein
MHTARQDEEDREVSGKPDPVREELRQIFYDTLKLDHNTPLGENARLGVLSSWDSLSHLKLLMAVETAFDVTVENVEELYTFDRLLKAIRARTQS